MNARIVVGRAWPWVLAVLLLGPALAPGFVLTYDMVWVPDLSLTPDAVGVGPGLPRAVPSDAMLSVLDTVVGGMVWQKLVLVGALVSAGLGAMALTAGLGLPARCAAAYGALPWLVLGARRHAREGRLPAVRSARADAQGHRRALKMAVPGTSAPRIGPQPPQIRSCPSGHSGSTRSVRAKPCRASSRTQSPSVRWCST